jgi:hypothetical protein
MGRMGPTGPIERRASTGARPYGTPMDRHGGGGRTQERRISNSQQEISKAQGRGGQARGPAPTRKITCRAGRPTYFEDGKQGCLPHSDEKNTGWMAVLRSAELMSGITPAYSPF